MFDGRGAPFNNDKVPIYSFSDVDVMRDPTWSARLSLLFHFASIGVADGGRGARKKNREKYFSGNYYVKFGHFSGKSHVKFGNFVTLLLGTLIFRANIIQIRIFC